MAFLNQKECIFDIVLTDRGRELLSKNQLSFNYYTFSDEGIDYSGSLSLTSSWGVSLDDYIHRDLEFEADQRKDLDLRTCLFSVPPKSPVVPDFRATLEPTGTLTLDRNYFTKILYSQTQQHYRSVRDFLSLPPASGDYRIDTKPIDVVVRVNYEKNIDTRIQEYIDFQKQKTGIENIIQTKSRSDFLTTELPDIEIGASPLNTPTFAGGPPEVTDISDAGRTIRSVNDSEVLPASAISSVSSAPAATRPGTRGSVNVPEQQIVAGARQGPSVPQQQVVSAPVVVDVISGGVPQQQAAPGTRTANVPQQQAAPGTRTANVPEQSLQPPGTRNGVSFGENVEIVHSVTNQKIEFYLATSDGRLQDTSGFLVEIFLSGTDGKLTKLRRDSVVDLVSDDKLSEGYSSFISLEVDK